VPTGGDVIVAIGGEPVDSHEGLMRHLLLETTPGEEVTVDLVRDGERLTERVTLAERPAPGGRRRRRDHGRGRGGSGDHIPVR
jgi:S1-C subfamily serine protease